MFPPTKRGSGWLGDSEIGAPPPPTDFKCRAISLFLPIINGALTEGFPNVRLACWCLLSGKRCSACLGGVKLLIIIFFVQLNIDCASQQIFWR